MALDVLIRKLNYLRQLLLDLAPYEEATLAQVEADHYKLERLFELLVVTATDLLQHLLAEQQLVPDSYRAAFALAASQNILPQELADRLQQAAGMRNVIVHLYEDIDYTILHESIGLALQDFNQFVAILAARLDDHTA
ncbi:MAG: DUF86 domain-containing protein [Ardenticatenaceae bacterium]|nr:DUF86 domain-containing protein [Ardenticatenaceae bacterium]